MTGNGWLQILLFLAVVLVVTRPLGRFMTRVFNRERTWLDPVLRPVERLIYRTTGVDDTREMRWTEYATAMLLFSVVSMLVLYLIQRVQQWLPWNPQGFGAVAARSRVQHRGVVHDQHELAGLRRRDDDELSHADGRARVPQLRVGRHRHRARDCIHPRDLTKREGHPRQFLGRSGPLLAVGVAAVLHRRGACAGLAGCRPESAAVRQGRGPRSADRDRAGCGRKAADTGRGRADHRAGAGRLAGNHQGVRHQRRRFHEREQRAPVREPDAAVELPRDGLYLCDLGRAHLHARTDDRISQARVGGLGRHGVLVSGRRDDGLLGGSARESAAHRRGRRPDGQCARAWRQHGRQGVPLRHRQLRALCHGDDRCELRRDQRLARLVHAARRPGAARPTSCSAR